MSEFDDLMGEIRGGMEGKNGGIPMGFDRLNRYIGIRKKIYTLVFGATGSGKSAYIHAAYILNPFDYYYKYKNTIKTKLRVMLFSMERSKKYTLAKWLCRKIFLDHAIIIPIPKMLGWWDTKLTLDEHDLIAMYEDYVGELMEVVTIIEGAQNPTAIYKYMKEYALKNGREEEIDEYRKIYIANNPDEIVEPIIDHMGLTKREKLMFSKKEAIDKESEYMQYFRDFYGYSPVIVSQLNRNMSNPIYIKLDSFEPVLDDIKESGRPGEDADVVTSLFDPIRYKTNDPDSRYIVDNFVDYTTGAKYFRSVKILKNTYGEDDISIRMAFQGATGIFKELPKAADMENFNYNDLFDGSYFLPEK